MYFYLGSGLANLVNVARWNIFVIVREVHQHRNFWFLVSPAGYPRTIISDSADQAFEPRCCQESVSEPPQQ